MRPREFWMLYQHKVERQSQGSKKGKRLSPDDVERLKRRIEAANAPSA